MDGNPARPPGASWPNSTEGRLAALEVEVRNLASRMDRMVKRVEIIFWVVLGTSGASLPGLIRSALVNGLQ